MTNREIKCAYTSWILSKQPNLAIMLGAGDGDISVMGLQKAATNFLNVQRREAFGRNWYLRRGDLFAIGFMEHLDTNRHMHMAVMAGDRHLCRRLEAGGSRWRKFRHGGDYHCETLDEPGRYASYIQKEYRRPGFWDDVFVYGNDRHDVPKRKL